MNIFRNKAALSRKALSATLSFAVVFSIFQPLFVFAAPVVNPDVITNLTTITTPGSSNWTVPAGVSEIRVKVWGAGGSAGNGATVSGNVLGGAGAGGAGYAERDVLVTPGETFSAIVGRGGISAEEGLGRSGQTSSFASSTVLVSASGGKAGKRGIEVQAPAPTVSLSASPAQVFEGNDVTITWSSTQADSCVASGLRAGSKTISGSESFVPASSGSISFSCSGIGGTASASVSITVDRCGPRGNCFGGTGSVRGASSADSTVATVNPLASAAADFTGAAGRGLVGTVLESGTSAAETSFNALGAIDSTNGGAGARGGAGGLRSTTVAGADGGYPGAGAGGSDVAAGGNGAHGQIVIESIVRGGPVTNLAPTGLVVTGPTVGTTSVSYVFTATAADPESANVRYGFDWNNDGTVDEYTSLVASGVSSSASRVWPVAGTYAFGVVAEDAAGVRSAVVAHTIVISSVGTVDPCGPRGNNCPPANVAPSHLVVTGPTVGTTSVSYVFTATAVDPENSSVRYGFDWDNNGSIDEFTSFVASGSASSTVHEWAANGTYTFGVFAEDVAGARSSVVTHTIVIGTVGPIDPCGPRGNNCPPVNMAPSNLVVTGPTVGTTSVSYVFTATAVDPENSSVRYGFDWNNDGTVDEYTSLVASGVSSSTSRVWSIAGTYAFGVFAEDVAGARSSVVTHTIVINASVMAGNAAPVVVMVTGPSTPTANVAYSYTASATDADADLVQYGFDWNNNGVVDGSESWTPLVASGVSASQSMSWGVSGPRAFGVFARDSRGATSTPFIFSVNVSGGLTNVGFALSTTTGLTTSESGSTASFTVVLTAAPTAGVTLPIMSSDLTEGTTSAQSVTFTPANWNVYQTIIVTGVDDSIDDGDIAYAVVVGPSTSADINFNGLVGQNVSLVNYDNDDTVVVTPPSTSGGGGGGGGGRSGPCIGFGCPVTGVTPTVTTTIVSDPIITFCPASDFIVSYLRKGSQNDANEVRKLQYFLNTYENLGVQVNGIFDDATEAAVKILQTRHADEILAPWNITEPTGIVYITTSSYINRFFCDENPLYKAGDLDRTINITPTDRPIIDNSGDFEGAIGLATTSASSTGSSVFDNLAGAFGAFSANVLGFLKSIPWYPILITLLVLIGSGLIIRGIYAEKMLLAPVSRMSFMQGATALGSGTVLNVLNTMSFMKDPAWFLKATGLGMTWVLALGLINLIAVVIVCIAFLVSAHIDHLRASK
jgi:hypothetical protein